MLRDAAVSLSLANLCFIKVWARVLSSAGAYFNEFPIVYAGIIVDVLLLAAVFFVSVRIARHTSSIFLVKIARWSFLLAVVTALNGIAMLIVTLSGINFSMLLGRDVCYVLSLGITVLAVFTAIKTRHRIVHVALRALVILLPFAMITFSQAAWKLLQNGGVVQAANITSQQPSLPRNKPATRVLWIIFDEMDQRMSFSERPTSLEMPELDRLRRESIYAINAYPPAPLTYMSLPALITGRLVASVAPARADELMVRFDGDQTAVGWSTQPNVFSEARKSGFTTGLAGWCHPYCEVIGNSLSKCDEVKENTGAEFTLKASMFSHAQGLISTIPLVQQAAMPIIQRVNLVNQIVTTGERSKYTVRYKRVLESALNAAVDPDLDLIFVHSPAPHPPGIYDRSKDDFSLESKNGYIDNLELVDRTVGELRRAMEQTGIWDKTTVIISADHWWRTEMWSRGPFWTREDAAISQGKMDHRIPFLVKLADQRNQFTYAPAFNTIVTHDLILALMRGEVSRPAEISAWLDQHRAITDSPYNRDELLP
jgi:Sulfatase